MQARLRLAALDNNHHIERQQATTRNGELRFKLQYSKPAGTYIAKPIKVAKTYDFHTELLCGVVQRFYAKKKTVHQQPAASIETNSTVTTGCCTLLSAQQCHVTILTFPPHCSHKLQPLARTVYGPFKRYYNNAADSWVLNHAGVNMVIYDLAQVVGSAGWISIQVSNDPGEHRRRASGERHISVQCRHLRRLSSNAYYWSCCSL